MLEGCRSAPATLGDLTDDEFMVWTGFLQSHAAVARGLDADLRAAHGLPLTEFEILLWLSRGACARMAALATRVQLSPSGLSRAVERLEARGLVRRVRCKEDRRGAIAELTASGADLVERASATQAAGIRRCFLERLTAEEMQAFATAWERVLAGVERSCSWSGERSPEDVRAECAFEEGEVS